MTSLRLRLAPGTRDFLAAGGALLLGLTAIGAWSPGIAEWNSIGLLRCNLFEPVDEEASGSNAAQVRQILCVFKKDGTQETYTGKVQVANLPAKEKGTLLWSVKAPSTMPTPPGFLQQTYSGHPKTPAGQIPDMIGQANSGVVLKSMADKKEGSAGAKDKSPAVGIIVLEVDLKLQGTTG
jgi:hypothetical protein